MYCIIKPLLYQGFDDTLLQLNQDVYPAYLGGLDQFGLRQSIPSINIDN